MQSYLYLQEILLLLGSGVATLIVMLKLRLSPVLGYLIVGATIAHYDLLHDVEYTKAISEYGVIFLLFVIGLSLSFEKLNRMRLYVFGFGGMQISLTAICIAFVLYKHFHESITVALIIGIILSFSSTAIVIQILNETKSVTTRVGSLSISALLMQDCVVVPLLVAIPLLASTNSASKMTGMLWDVELKAIAIVTICIVIGRTLLRPFFLLIKSLNRDETYVNVALFIVIGAAWITEINGLSTAMGAFLAGLLIAETEYRGKIEESIMPFQGLFLALFFISTGMCIDVNYIVSNFQKVIILSFLLMFIKACIIFGLCKLFKFSNSKSINAALLLCQCSEFAFVSFGIATKQGLISNELSQLFFMIVSFTMALTPLLASIGRKMEYKNENESMMDNTDEFKGVSELEKHVIIAGFGRVGKVVAFMLEQKGVDYVAVDSNIALVKKARMEGYQIYHGDMTSYEVMKALGAERASLLILSMDDISSLRKAIKKIKPNFKHKLIITRVEDCSQGNEVRKLGATISIPTTTEVGIRLGTEALLHMDIPEHKIVTIIDKMRKNHYELTENIELLSNRMTLQKNR